MTSARLHHAPSDCPVCGDRLITIRKGCLSCGTELVGEFAGCEFCALDDAELALLRVFLASRGNVREIEKHLGVSYPTARARLTALLERLGLADHEDSPESTLNPEAEGVGSEQEQILAQVASGRLSPADAAALLAR